MYRSAGKRSWKKEMAEMRRIQAEERARAAAVSTTIHSLAPHTIPLPPSYLSSHHTPTLVYDHSTRSLDDTSPVIISLGADAAPFVIRCDDVIYGPVSRSPSPPLRWSDDVPDTVHTVLAPHATPAGRDFSDLRTTHPWRTIRRRNHRLLPQRREPRPFPQSLPKRTTTISAPRAEILTLHDHTSVPVPVPAVIVPVPTSPIPIPAPGEPRDPFYLQRDPPRCVLPAETAYGTAQSALAVAYSARTSHSRSGVTEINTLCFGEVVWVRMLKKKLFESLFVNFRGREKIGGLLIGLRTLDCRLWTSAESRIPGRIFTFSLDQARYTM
ncbi:hypothetical protein B0H10DRAFT_1970788 [Mycena sp. CBHHK59/15]|nr:hypothetical protein B0H10DRAFT_1970788 [Mycena sp. CBHHK59/15]